MNKQNGHQEECFLKAGFPKKGRYLTKRIKATGNKKEDLENSRIILLSKINEYEIDEVEPSREELAARLVYEDTKNTLESIREKMNKSGSGILGYLKKRKDKRRAKKTFKALKDFVEAWEDKLSPNKYIEETTELVRRAEREQF